MTVPFNLFHAVIIGVFLIWSLIRFGMSWNESSGWPVLDNLIASFVSLILIISWVILNLSPLRPM